MAIGRRLQREHIVAAGLVGTVVVVVGFASGLGMRPQADGITQAQPAPPARTPATRSATTPPPNTGTGTGGGGIGGGGGGIPLPQPIQGRPDPVEVTPTHSAHPPAPTTSPATPATPTSPPPSLPPCDPGLLRILTDTVDGTVGSLTGLLGLPTEPLAPLTDPLLGTACLPASTAASTPPPSALLPGN
jgi:hypothetical protein